MDAELAQALIADKLLSLALLVVGIGVLWRRFSASSDKLIDALTGKLDAVVSKLGDVEKATQVGLAGVSNKLDEHGRRLAAHERRLDRHSDMLRAVGDPGRSGIYTRPRAVGEEDAR